MNIDQIKQHFNEEYHDFLKKTYYQIKKIKSGQKFIYLGFVNPYEEEIISKIIGKDNINIVDLNENENSERKNILLEHPSVTEHYYQRSFKSKKLRLKYNDKFVKLRHQQVLGTLLKNDIPFASFGDITFSSDDSIYIETTNELAQKLLNEGILISNHKINFEEVDIIGPKRKPKAMQFFVKSPRLDTVIKNICKVNKGKSLNLIGDKSVRLNYQINDKAKTKVQANDVISVRRYGKFKVANIEETKASYKITVEEEL